MPAWVIEPRDPLIARDGRPFGPEPGARARSLDFPFPSSIAGGVRNRAGLDAQGRFDRACIDAVKQIAVAGPLLVDLDDENSIGEWYAPAPADALLLTNALHPEVAHLQWVRPLQLRTNECVSPYPIPTLAPVGPAVFRTGKPHQKAPAFWGWKRFAQWLTAPADHDSEALCSLGLEKLRQDWRMHVRIEANTQTAFESFLFQTSGLVFTGLQRKRLGLLVEVTEPFKHFSGGLAPLGGERRLMRWIPSTKGLPTCPPAIYAQIIAQRACRIILLTPGFFSAGIHPEWLLNRTRLPATLKAVAIQRYQVVSGWAMAAPNRQGSPGRPKPTSRLAPAGTTLFLTLPPKDQASDAAVRNWIDAIWMQSVSDDDDTGSDQFRRDGFGLAAVGTWDGQLRTMEVSK